MFIIKYNFTYMQVIHTIMAQIHNRGKKKNSIHYIYYMRKHFCVKLPKTDLPSDS